ESIMASGFTRTSLESGLMHHRLAASDGYRQCHGRGKAGNPAPCPVFSGRSRTTRRLTPAHRREALLLSHTVGVRATGPARRTPDPERLARGAGREDHSYTTTPPRHRAPARLAAQTRQPGTAHSERGARDSPAGPRWGAA